MVPACPGCGLRFPREEGQWLGSWFLNVCLVQTVLVVALGIEVAISWPERPSWPWLTAVVVAAVVVPVAFFPWSRTLWAAIDLCMRPLGMDDGVAPGVELEQLDEHRRRRRRSPGPRWGGPKPVQGPRPPRSPARRRGPGPTPGDGPPRGVDRSPPTRRPPARPDENTF